MLAEARRIARPARRWANTSLLKAQHRDAARIYEQFRDLTMVPLKGGIANLEVAAAWRNVPGDIVECGVWRGGMSGAIATIAPGHHSVLFDSFEGLPDAKPIDGESAVKWSTEIRGHDNCSADEKFAYEAMRRSGSTDYEILKGWFDDTVPKWAAQQRPIAILRLDGDWYDSTMVCLKHLYPLVVPGGGIIIDDYYTWDGCTRAVHDYLSQTGSSERIRSARVAPVAYIPKLHAE